MPACVNHPEVETALSCAGCARPLCRDCLVDFQAVTYCGYCRDAVLTRMQTSGTPSAAVRPRGNSATDHLIPAKNPAALAGYYLGVFSFIPCVGNILGPAAIIAGIMGFRARRRNPELPGAAHAVVAIVLGTLTTVGYWALTIFLISQAGK